MIEPSFVLVGVNPIARLPAIQSAIRKQTIKSSFRILTQRNHLIRNQ